MQTKIVVVVGRYPGEEEVRVRVRKADYLNRYLSILPFTV